MVRSGAQLFDDDRAGSRIIAQRAPANRFLERFQDIGWEAIGIGGKRPFQLHPHQFPMPGGRVLARRDLRHFAVNGRWLFLRFQARDQGDIAQPHFFQIG